MIHSTRLSIAAIFLALSPFAAGQELARPDFEARRKELRGRFDRASSPAEKAAIHEEFRRLELEAGGDPVPTGSGDLERSLGNARAASSGPARGTGETGLGARGDAKPDPRIRQLEALLTFTRWELSSAATPDLGTLAASRERAVDGTPLSETSRDTMRDYRQFREELRGWVEAGQAELDTLKKTGKPSGAMTTKAMADWEHALGETGADRRFLAGWLARHHAEQIARKRTEVLALRTSLKNRLASLDRIQKAMKDAEVNKKAVQLVFDLKDVVEILDNLGNVLQDVGHLPAAALDRLYDKVVEDPVENRIAAIAGRIFDRAVEIELAGEGYENLDEVLNAIKSDSRELRQAKEGLADSIQSLQQAREREEAPRWRSGR